MEDFGNSVRRIGLIADTHVPDRRKALHPGVVPTFSQLKVDLILHAGDVCSRSVITQLEETAPVRAIRGNRDLIGLEEYQNTYLMKTCGFTIGLSHGHGNMLKYLVDKVKYIIRGPQVFGIARRRALEMFSPPPDVLVFGHNHNPEIRQIDSTIVINPGSPCCPIPRHLPPTVGLIEIKDGEVYPSIISLDPEKPLQKNA